MEHRVISIEDWPQPGVRLDSFVRERLPDLTRGAVQRLIEEGFLTVNQRKVKASYHPRQGDVIHITIPEAEPSAVQPQEIPLEILFEDRDIIVINKPAGMVVHPAAGHSDQTLVNALLHHCGDDLSGIGGVARPGIVHRLDMDTSGCLVVAKNDAAHQSLVTQFSGRTVSKVYRLLAAGGLSAGEKVEVDQPIGRHPVHRKQMAVLPPGQGREARTTFIVEKTHVHACLLRAVLHTGRTHQIRVHARFAGCPLIGDDVYGRKATQRFQAAVGFRVARQMLHAWRIGFHHPVSRKPMRFEAPEPEDFRELVALLWPSS